MLILIDQTNKNGIIYDKYKSIKKSGNKTIKILAKSKSQNLLKLKFQNKSKLNKSIKVQSTNIKEEFKFLILDAIIVFIE